jgi:deoxyribodipyrimidine photo-lyase
MNAPVIFWFRRDLRLNDNRGLAAAATQGNIIPVFIFDTSILNKLPAADARVEFIHNTLTELAGSIQQMNGKLQVYYGNPTEIWSQIVEKFKPKAVYLNEDYEPYAIKRDENVKNLLASHGIPMHSFKDQVIWSPSEILSQAGTPYTVYTPYSKVWLKKLSENPETFTPSQNIEEFNKPWFHTEESNFPTLNSMGFKKTAITFPENAFQTTKIKNYHETRNIPGLDSTSKLGLHLRFGTISIRNLVAHSLPLNETFVKELAWREFFMQILRHFPHAEKEPFRSKYQGIKWINNEKEFEAWKQGKTGYPIVDAGMRELATTGFMHNRVRMITASFLVKHLLIDYRWGESWFAEKLLDFDLASNNGNWQWVAGTGCDAAPYFRVFNPDSQMQRFDEKAVYIRKWVPEFESLNYINHKIVDHKMARERAISTYKTALSEFI